jgi:hypothetical protein
MESVEESRTIVQHCHNSLKYFSLSKKLEVNTAMNVTMQCAEMGSRRGSLCERCARHVSVGQ